LAAALLTKPWLGYRYQSSGTAGWYAQFGLTGTTSLAPAGSVLPTTGSPSALDGLHAENSTSTKFASPETPKPFLCATPR
jgi:hypothetical protein